MTILGAYMVPHPPLIVPAVGRGEEKVIHNTIAAYEEVARRIAALKPETIVVTTPHSILYSDYFHISPGAAASGSFAQFGAPQEKMLCTYDQQFVAVLEDFAEKNKLPCRNQRRKES
jgi:aromatic ring-opening dioxygenase LigB subunit